MSKYYKYGELLLILRKEYMGYKILLNELKRYVDIKSEYENMYFTGRLAYNDCSKNPVDKEIRLIVEKKYNELLKTIQNIRYNWYSMYLYTANYKMKKNNDGNYVPVYDNECAIIDNKDKYNPSVEITNPEKFSDLIDQIFSTDLMQTQQGHFAINQEAIDLNFDEAYIFSKLENQTIIHWDGINDTFRCSCDGHFYPALIREVLSLEMPEDKISDDWLKLLEKHKNDSSLRNYDVDVSVKANAELEKEPSLLNN